MNLTDDEISKRAMTPEEQSAASRVVQHQPDPTTQVVKQRDNEADGLRLQPRSFGVRPGTSALDFAEDDTTPSEDEVLSILATPSETVVHLYPAMIVATVALALAALAVGLALGLAIAN